MVRADVSDEPALIDSDVEWEHTAQNRAFKGDFEVVCIPKCPIRLKRIKSVVGLAYIRSPPLSSGIGSEEFDWGRPTVEF
jgi:hypothetical protein